MIHTIETMPTESFDSMDSPVGPDAHFGDSVFRPSQKENCSRTRAEELGKMLELSDDREMDLNRKKGHFRNETKQAPSLGAGRMNLAQATALYEKGVKEKSQTKKENDILLSEHERKEARTKAYELLVRKTTRGKFYVVPNFCWEQYLRFNSFLCLEKESSALRFSCFTHSSSFTNNVQRLYIINCNEIRIRNAQLHLHSQVGLCQHEKQDNSHSW